MTQAWLAANGRHHDVLVGVRVAPSFLAHAWVEGYDAISADEYTVLARIDADGVHDVTG